MRRLVLLVLASFACGGGPEPVVVAPPLHVHAKPPTPPRARWVFSAPEQEIRAKLAIDEHQTLYAGEHGRRELEVGGQLQHAPTLAEEPLVGVLRDAKRGFVFVAADGDAYVSTEPLGPLTRVSSPRSEPLGSVTAGRAAILGISHGSLVRSSDGGATWGPVDYAGGKKPFGEASSVALDGKGNGLLVHLPQRLYVTHDDGATWAPIASPRYGASRTLRDGADRLFVIGYHDMRATLAGDALAETNDAPTPMFHGQAAWQARSFSRPSRTRFLPRPGLDDLLPRDEPLRLLAGDRVVEIALRAGKAEVRSAALGEPLGAPSTSPDLDRGAIDGHRVSAWQGELAYLRTGTDDDADAPGSTLLRSHDHGATWTKEEALVGAPLDSKLAVALGPRGWTYVGALCASHDTGGCKPPKIRPAGKTTFVDSDDLDFDPRAFVFDEAHGAVYALADASGGSVLYAGTLESGKLARTSLLFASPSERVALTVDAAGTLRAFDRSGRWTTLHERTANGQERPARYLDLGVATLAFAGTRGLAIGDHASFETSDAGETWTRVPSNGSTSGISCSAAGCLLAGAERVGWDLPAVQSTEIVRASNVPPTEPTPTHPPVQPSSPPVTLTCAATGKSATVGEFGESWTDGLGRVRWARTAVNFANLSAGLTYADATATHSVQLLASPSTSKLETRMGVAVRDEGVMAAHYRFASRSATGKLNPVEVDLAWWTPSKPRVRHATLHVEPFRVSRFGFSGVGHVVDGGVAFQSADERPIHFVSDDGKQETLTAPPIPASEAWRSGKRWLLLDADDEVLEMALSDDGGKTWSLRGWAFGRMPASGDSLLETAGGKLTLRAGDALYDVAWPVANDPPPATALDTTAADARCDGLPTGTTPHQTHVRGASPIVMHLGGETYTATDRVLHDTASGKVCASAYAIEQGRDASGVLVPGPGGAWSGWTFRSVGDKSLAQPFVCK